MSRYRLYYRYDSSGSEGNLIAVCSTILIGHICASVISGVRTQVLERTIERGCKVRITREGKLIHEGDLGSLKRFKDDVKEVRTGYECGLVFDGFNDIQEFDIVEAYKMVEVPRK